MNLIKQNIDNLTNLWALGGQTSGIYIDHNDYAISKISGSEWPNKLWFHEKPNKRVIQQILQDNDLGNIAIAIWHKSIPDTEVLLRSFGFTEKNSLTGMSIRLNQLTYNSQNLSIQKVTKNDTAKIWSHLFQSAFGYQIHWKTIVQTMMNVDYFIGYLDNIPLGTAALYKHADATVGIHSMGIIPEYRRKGFAEAILSEILNTAGNMGASYATLQASDMGKGLYSKTGFREDFSMKHFVIHQTS